VSDAAYTVSGVPVSGDAGVALSEVLVIFDSGNLFQPSAFVACTSGGQDASTFVSLGAFLPPQIIGAREVAEGDTLDLDCDASNSSPLPSVAWFSPQSGQVSDDRFLVMEDISRSEAGNYSCVATDSGGATQSSSVSVIVTYAPALTTPHSGLQHFPLGSALNLSCVYEAVPAPDSITWRHNGTTLLMMDMDIGITSNVSTTLLTRTALAGDGGGNYTCNVANAIGSSSAEIAVQIQLPPSSPTDLVVVASSADSLLLAWGSPEFTGFSAAAGFRVVVTEDGTSSKAVVVYIPDGMATSHDVTGLQPLRVYAVDVYTRNEAGLEGEPASVTGRTASLTLPLVIMLEVQVISSTQLYLQWAAPVINATTTAAPEFYLVSYSNSGGGDSLMATGLNFTLQGLEKGAEYTVSVAGVNEAGTGEVQTAGPVQTGIDAPDAPHDFDVTSPTPFSLSLSWMQPLDDGGRPLQHYKLQLFASSHPVRTEMLEAEDTLFLLQDLVQNTSYMLELVAVNSAGLESQAASATVTTLPVGQPQTPVSAGVNDITSTTAIVSWSEVGGYPDYYVLQYTDTKQSNGSETVQVLQTYYELADLQPLNDYTVRIASHNINGLSDLSHGILFGTYGQVMIEGPASGPYGEPLTLTCAVETTPSSPSPHYLWSREGESLPTHAMANNVTGTLTLLEPSPTDGGVYVCFTAGVHRRISVSIDPKPQSSTTAVVALVVSLVLAVVVVIAVSLFCLVFCVCWRRHYRQYDFKAHKKRWEQEMKSTS
jgi:hypothetical protein